MEDFFKWIIAGFAGGAGIWLLIKSSLEKYTGAFLEEKGKNLATKQDIGKITKIVEGIKHENSLLLEEVKGKLQLRLAVIEKRIDAYQSLYTSIHQIFDFIIYEKIMNYASEYFTHGWLMEFTSNVYNQFLYLSSNSRNQMLTLISLLSEYRTKSNEEKEKMFMEISKTVLLTLNLLAGDVELPSIGRNDYKAFEKLSEFVMAQK